MKEKEKWAHIASTTYQEATACGTEEANGLNIGWKFGFDSAKARIDKRLDVIQRSLLASGLHGHVEMMKDVRNAITTLGELEK